MRIEPQRFRSAAQFSLGFASSPQPERVCVCDAAICVADEMFGMTKKQGLHPTNLERGNEDSGIQIGACCLGLVGGIDKRLRR